MPMTDALLPEFDHEMTVTRRLLERVPDDKLAFKPHPKSTSLGGLATHVTNLPLWGEMTLGRSELDLGAAGRSEELTSRSALLAAFDAHVAKTRALLTAASDGEMMAPWTLKNNGQTVFSMPKAMVWRSFVLSHLVHHRGQLSVYLRLLDVPIPSIYGPSADESSF